MSSSYFLFLRQNVKKISFAVSNPPKCIANLSTQPMYFKMNLEIYQTSFVMKEVVYSILLFQFDNLFTKFDTIIEQGKLQIKYLHLIKILN